MKSEDLKKVFKVISTVDGGCQTCIKNALEELMKEFPENDDEIKKEMEGW
jgi:hypothetical protein